ncbi:hypothetical protein CFOL_v3_20859 [Cephalotus follicularis]|uniref:Uncharacterized protein n=1 Tax=Cephalotus follicularis TaxID=3775 RepID=A0A1Q3CBA3_CEPFO|nr:hypothetical protein CFOL_v3_20859 [Cephalotus follicularis]
MAPESCHGHFKRVNLEGSNVGAAMHIRRGVTGEKQDCCSINIYVNNNIQGVNISCLLGSEVKLRNPGVCLYFGEVELDRGWGGLNMRNKDNATGLKIGCCVLVLSVIILLLLTLFF